MPQFDPGTFLSQIFWLVVSFSVLYFLVLPAFLRKLSTVRDEREDRIAGDLKRAEAMRDDAKRILGEYEAKLAEARATAQSHARDIAEQVANDTTAAQAALSDELAARLSAAESRIDAAREAALAELESTASDLAASVVRKLAGVDVDANTALRAVRSVH